MATSFHLASSLALDSMLNFITDEGCKYFKKLIERLSDEPFNLISEDRYLLTNLLTERTDEMGWNTDIVGIIFISLEPTNPNSDIVNILSNCGEVTLETMQEFKKVYIN